MRRPQLMSRRAMPGPLRSTGCVLVLVSAVCCGSSVPIRSWTPAAEMSVEDAWHDQCEAYQPPGNTSRVFGAVCCMLDSLGSGGPIWVGRDPYPDSTYMHTDHTVE